MDENARPGAVTASEGREGRKPDEGEGALRRCAVRGVWGTLK